MNREFVYLLLASVFVASLVACNLIFQKFFFWEPFGLYRFEVSVGILPYPITFLVTDIVSEIFGKRAATRMVTVGFIASIFISSVVMVSLAAPATEWSPLSDEVYARVFGLNGPAVMASLTAYLLAQYCDVRLFHFWRELTSGKHLWLRNNASTMLSQLVDTISVLSVLSLSGVISWEKFPELLLNGYLFKVVFAALDTPLIYLGVWYLKPLQEQTH